jgi:hypothetical protein
MERAKARMTEKNAFIVQSIRCWRLVCACPMVVANAIGYAKVGSRSHRAVIRVYDDAGNAIETHKHAGEFKEW